MNSEIYKETMYLLLRRIRETLRPLDEVPTEAAIDALKIVAETAAREALFLELLCDDLRNKRFRDCKAALEGVEREYTEFFGPEAQQAA